MTSNDFGFTEGWIDHRQRLAVAVQALVSAGYMAGTAVAVRRGEIAASIRLYDAAKLYAETFEELRQQAVEMLKYGDDSGD